VEKQEIILLESVQNPRRLNICRAGASNFL
jgi:hypothetical protein